MSDSWQLLDEEFFNDVRKTLEGKKVKLTPFQPRPHQKKALKDSKNYFIKEDHSRGKLIFPCGAGKSYLKSQKEWIDFCKSGKRPSVIPAAPNQKYKDQWKGWADFLGKEK